MTVVEYLLVFAGAPLAVILLLTLLTMRPGKGSKRLRYRPGQAWEHQPVWFEPHPESAGGNGHGPATSQGPAAVPGSGTAALGSSMYPEQPGERELDSEGGSGPAVGAGASTGTAGGSSDGARRPNPGGPLGGARGTW